MGMYDHVIAPRIHCPRCDAWLKGWQSKDGPCKLGVISYLKVSTFYTSCTCGEIVEMRLRQARSLNDFAMFHARVGATRLHRAKA